MGARLGFDPFRPDADLLIEAKIQRAEQGLTGTLQVTNREGRRAGRREFTSAAGDCPELASAMGLAMGLHFL